MQQPHIHPSLYLPSEGLPVSAPSQHMAASRPNDSRVALIIPIRGKLPWKGYSSGLLVDDSEDSISLLEKSSDVMWTRTSLLAFWQLLLDLRAAGTMGAIGISFHPGQSGQRTGSMVNNPQSTVSYLTKGVGTQHALRTIDYIKVYHDYQRRLFLRRFLADWTCPGFPARVVLRDACLILLDDISQPILLS